MEDPHFKVQRNPGQPLKDVDLARGVLVFRRGKGAKTLKVALHAETRAALLAYLERGRPLLLGDAGDDPGVLCCRPT